ncbi:hypothetical protein FSARC_9437 [Fusarium sarcochroum]|uniref:Uncharacterized protein n=1 Tax=Fusarium sarcochroum TaxID=1208366 RepID=A0A8H4TRC5_9HYPO|nr:hypothetical protein FSARC_9437 [Fusarium sarcochroum]
MGDGTSLRLCQCKRPATASTRTNAICDSPPHQYSLLFTVAVICIDETTASTSETNNTDIAINFIMVRHRVHHHHHYHHHHAAGSCMPARRSGDRNRHHRALRGRSDITRGYRGRRGGWVAQRGQGGWRGAGRGGYHGDHLEGEYWREPVEAQDPQQSWGDAGVQEEAGGAWDAYPGYEEPRLRPENRQMRIINSLGIVPSGLTFRVINRNEEGPQTDICARVPGRRNAWVARTSCIECLLELQALARTGRTPDEPCFIIILVAEEESTRSIIICSCRRNYRITDADEVIPLHPIMPAIRRILGEEAWREFA